MSEWLSISELKLGDIGHDIEVSADGSIVSGEFEHLRVSREKEPLPFDRVRVKEEIVLTVGPFFFGVDMTAKFRRRE
jgi:hypothetical protein